MPRKRTTEVPTTKLLEGVTGAELLRQMPVPETKGERLEIRLSAAEKELIERLAKRCGVSVTTLVVTLAKVADEKFCRD